MGSLRTYDGNGYDGEEYKNRNGPSRGIYDYSITENGGAAAAGIQKGDIITSVAGTEVGTMNRINTVLVSYKDGDTVNVTYLRAGVEYSVEVVLSSGAN